VADPVQEIINQKAVTDELQAVSMDSTPVASDSRLASQQNETAYREGFKIVPDQVSGEEFFNLYNEALASILNITADPITTMRKMQAVINKPAQFEVAVKNRIDTFVDLFNSNRRNLDKLTEPSSKKIFQIVCGAIVSAMCTGSAQPQAGNYTNKQSVFTIINQIVSTYNQYIADLDTLQSANNSNSSSFIPDWTSQAALNKLVNYTISTLFTIALGAKQERTYICEQDTNVILLTHRFLGLDKNDANINTMIEINNIGLNEMLNIRKGREIIYYV
jgi:ribosomal protein S17E